jgi:hypothetical protein
MEPDGKTAKATSSDVRNVLGSMSETRVAAILAIGPTVEELEEAAAFAAGESDVMGELRKPASGRVAAVYDIIAAVEEPEEDRE